MPRKTDRDGLYQQPGSPNWYGSYTDANGCRCRRSTGTDNRREVEAILSQWKTQSHQQRLWGVEPAHGLHELLLAYVDAHSTKRGLDRDGYSVRHLYRLLGADCVLNRLRPAEVHHYSMQRRQEGAGPGTINRELGLLSSALNWARRRLGWQMDNPAEG